MKFTIRKASLEDLPVIWEIIQQAIEKRRLEKSLQWQNGYPNKDTILSDIEKDYGYVLQTENGKIVSYIAIIFDGEPAYEHIDGQWLSENKYAVLHRLAVKQNTELKGIGTQTMQWVETIVKAKNIKSIRVDTNFDNTAMLRVFEKMGFMYCGEVMLPGGIRKAFEKIIA